MQQKETDNHPDLADLSRVPASGRLLALDLGTKRIGVAITDEMRIVATPLDPILRTSWKKLLLSVRGLISDFDAKGLVIGLPYGFEGEETPMFHEALRLARNFVLSSRSRYSFRTNELRATRQEAGCGKKGMIAAKPQS